jgi:hypothetical protein
MMTTDERRTMTERTPLTGRALVQAVYDRIKDHPERHDQRIYLGRRAGEEKLCTSTGCVAGWTALFARPDLAVAWAGVHVSDYADSADSLRDASGNHFGVDGIATGALGLTDREADFLFDGSRSRDAVLAALRRLLNGERPMPSSCYPEG